MKAIFIVIAVVTFNLSSFSQTTAYQQLISVNNKWLQVTDFDESLKTLPAKTLNEQQLIQFHLQQTEKLLRSRNADNLTVEQKQQRSKLLNILHSYSIAGKFPQNTQHQNRQPYFIDDFNTYCAVGYLMQQSGADAMAKEIKATQNFNYLEDIHHTQLMNWVQQSGFTIDELALIQPGYGGEHPAYISEIHYNNIGQDVNEYIEIVNSNGELIGLINFDSVFFYNKSNFIYKKIGRNQMTNPTGIICYYAFAGGADTLCDIGKIELINSTYSNNPHAKIADFIYTNDSINMHSYYYNGSIISLLSRSTTIVENDNTPIGQSLNICGSLIFMGITTPTISAATIGTLNSCVITPVNLATFNSTIKENAIQLNWQTLTETNNNFFEIERSNDGKNFTSIGKITAKKISGVNDYNFIDAKPNYLNHYRLKQVDNDGKFSYSKILFVKMPSANPLSIVANITKTVVQVNVALDDNKINVLELYDLFGKKLKQYKAIQGNQQLNIEHLASGKYILLLKTTVGEVYQQQVIIVQ